MIAVKLIWPPFWLIMAKKKKGRKEGMKRKKKDKGKALPLLALSGPEGSRKLKFPDFMKTAQDDGKVVSLTHRPPLPPGNTPGNHFC
jgi:hypothetical protein